MEGNWIQPAVLSFRIFLGRIAVMPFFAGSQHAVKVSFFLAFWLLPLQAIRIQLYGTYGLPAEVGVMRFWHYELLSYCYFWVTWPVLCVYILPKLPQWSRVPSGQFGCYLACYNWLNLPLLVVILLLDVVAYGAGFSYSLALSLQMGVVIWHAILHWYLLRDLLGFPTLFSVALVLADFLIGQMIYLTLTSFMLFG